METENREPAICDECGQHLFPPEDDGLTEVDNGSEVCQKCLQEDYVFSRDLDVYLHVDDAVFSDCLDDWLDREDAAECNDCGAVVRSEDAFEVGHGSSIICESCRDSGHYAYPADDEDTLYHIDYLYWCDRAEEYYCDEDNAPSSRISEYLHCYSTDVFEECGDTVFTASGTVSTRTAKREKLLCYGVELETGSRDYNGAAEIAEHLCENTDYQEFGICKEDGSISGAEMVTLPATLAAHRSRLDWQTWCRYLREVAKGHYGNAGMHVHVNKAALSPLTLGKVLVFCNDRGNERLLSVIAQRDISNCSWCEQHPLNYDKVGKAGKHGNTSGKYSAVNVTYSTVEFRIFNSNLQPERILKNLEFVEAVIKWCRVVSARDITGAAFVAYVHANRKQYPELSAFLAENYTDNTEETKLCA